MKKIVLNILFLFAVLVCSSQQNAGYKSPDARDPILFEGDHIVYQGKTILLGPKAFFIDGQLSGKEAAKYSHVFNSVNEAAKHLTDGTEASPMVLYIAPSVYWIDNPDDPEIRIPKATGSTPFGLEIKCEWLKFYGLSDYAKNVVLACNRGQTMGAKGNFTMLRISGQGTSAENITFGNYCNIDLVYPLKPELGRQKRGSAIVQAQLVFCDGDKLVARNTRFVSRLNLSPFAGGKRTLFDRCLFESTDDALNGTAVYLNCILKFYSGKPFWGTVGTGAVFLGCDVNSYTRGEQYFTKSKGQVAAVDTRFESETLTYLGWRDIPAKESRNYQFNIQLSGEPVLIGKYHPQSTVDMTGKAVINAYRFIYKDEVIYNTYNLLSGDDNWDPMGIKSLVNLKIKPDGTCVIIPTNTNDEMKEVIVTASTSSGLEAASVVYVTPSILNAPEFSLLPTLKKNKDGRLTLDYKLDMKFRDQSLVNWYRCSDAKGNNPIEIAVSRLNEPKLFYVLSSGDMGYYIMAKVSPKHLRSMTGEPVAVLTAEPVSAIDVKADNNILDVDLKSLSTKYQPEVKPGFWTLDCYAPADTYDWTADNSGDPWYYGGGTDGAINATGLVQANKGARLRYTPVGGKFGDMNMKTGPLYRSVNPYPHHATDLTVLSRFRLKPTDWSFMPNPRQYIISFPTGLK